MRLTDGLMRVLGRQARKPSGWLGKMLYGHLAARIKFPLYSGAEMVELLTAAGFSRAWFESAPDKGWGWLCALGVKL